MPSRLLLLLTLAAALVAGCGGGAAFEPADSTTDASQLLQDTFRSVNTIGSASIDAKLTVTGGQSFDARVSGPFERRGAGKLPKFQLAATVHGGGSSFSGGATWTGEKGYVTIAGTSYELPGLLARQVEAGYEESLKSGKGGGALLAALGIDPASWIKDARNEGDAQAGGVDAIKLTGQADIPRIADDLQALAEKARTLNLPGGAQAPSAQARQRIVDAVKQASVEVYAGKADRVLRRLLVTADVQDPASKQLSHVTLDVTLSNVGADQQITAPKDAKPFSDLQQSFGGLMGLAAAGSAPRSG